MGLISCQHVHAVMGAGAGNRAHTLARVLLHLQSKTHCTKKQGSLVCCLRAVVAVRLCMCQALRCTVVLHCALDSRLPGSVASRWCVSGESALLDNAASCM